MNVGVIYDERFLRHEAAFAHPERPERLEACVASLKDAGLWQQMVRVPAQPISWDELEGIHDARYLDFLKSWEGRAGSLDPDTFCAEGSIVAALAAAGGVRDLTRGVLEGTLDAGLALVRPPGHHAERDRACGFCLIGNVAVGAMVAKQQGMKVAVVDFDVHHCNGTQDIFYEDDKVYVCSIHRYGAGFFPGTGVASETGRGLGQGTTLNVPLPVDVGDNRYLDALDQSILPALRQFRPDLLLVSAGFDAHERDPLGGHRVSDEGFVAIINRLASLAEEQCQGRWVAVLEGGYDLTALASGVTNLARALLKVS